MGKLINKVMKFFGFYPQNHVNTLTKGHQHNIKTIISFIENKEKELVIINGGNIHSKCFKNKNIIYAYNDPCHICESSFDDSELLAIKMN